MIAITLLKQISSLHVSILAGIQRCSASFRMSKDSINVENSSSAMGQKLKLVCYVL